MNDSGLFGASGCLTQEGIRRYLAGRLSAREKRQVADHLAECPLCSESLEGLRSMTSGQAGSHFGELHRRFGERYGRYPGHRAASRQGMMAGKMIYVALAASVVLLAGIYILISRQGLREGEVTQSLEEHEISAIQDSQAVPTREEKTALPSSDTTAAGPEEEPVALSVPHGETSTGAGGLTAEGRPDQPGEMTIELQSITAEPPGTLPEPKTVPDMIPPSEPAVAMGGESNRVIEYTIPQGDEVAGNIAEEEEDAMAREEKRDYALSSSAGQKGSSSREAAAPAEKYREEPMIFTVVEVPPQFPGGDTALSRYLEENLIFPEKARKGGIEGTVYTTFIVETDGRITEEMVIQGLSRECDNEALRLIREMPAWTPGAQNGTPVRVLYALPVRFKL